MSSTHRGVALGLILWLAFLEVWLVPSNGAAEPTKISAQELLSSPFAESFKSRDYKKALAALDELANQYPNDPLILRYRAATLMRLGHTREAIAVYRTLLAQNPSHIPTRLFLARAYARLGDREKSAEQWRWIIQNSGSDESEEYRRWAQVQLNRLRVGKVAVRRGPAKKKPYLLGKVGIKYDSNPLLKPDDKNLAAQGNEKAGGFLLMDLLVGYPLILRPDGRFDVIYVGQQTFHDEETDKVDFTTQGIALDAKKKERVGGRSVVFGSRYDFQTGWLRSDLFSVMNRLLLSADTSFTPRTRTYFYSRSSYINFGPDGSNPTQTSRDGFRGGLGVTQYFYSADFLQHLFIKQELNLNETRGTNFIRRGELTRVGAHTPMPFLPKTDFDVSLGFDLGTYPKFVSLSSLDTTRRRDVRWDVYAAFTHYWKPNLATRASYRYINADNRNDFFDRTRHVAGLEMVFSL